MDLREKYSRDDRHGMADRLSLFPFRRQAGRLHPARVGDCDRAVAGRHRGAAEPVARPFLQRSSGTGLGRLRLAARRLHRPGRPQCRALHLPALPQPLGISVGLLSAVVSLASFVIILWGLSAASPLTIYGREFAIPGYLVWGALIYAVLGTALTQWIGA